VTRIDLLAYRTCIPGLSSKTFFAETQMTALQHHIAYPFIAQSTIQSIAGVCFNIRPWNCGFLSSTMYSLLPCSQELITGDQKKPDCANSYYSYSDGLQSKKNLELAVVISDIFGCSSNKSCVKFNYIVYFVEM
jgi:hypothetical protein